MRGQAVFEKASCILKSDFRVSCGKAPQQFEPDVQPCLFSDSPEGFYEKKRRAGVMR